MPTAETTRGGRPRKPAALRRTEWLKLRVSPAEMEAAQARAGAEGMSLSAFVRQRCCIDPGGPSRPRRRGSGSPTSIEAPGREAVDPELEHLVARFRLTMPLRNAESLAKAELRRRKERPS